MYAALLTTVLFSISIIFGHRTAKMIGGTEANFWRLTFATTFLGIWAHTFGSALTGDAFPIFFLSGIIGIGIGDVALFQALPRLGSRLTLLLVQCMTPPAGALIEWLWLGTGLTIFQMTASAVILTGVVVALKPGEHFHLSKGKLLPGVLFGVVAAVGNAFGAVLSRKAYAVLNDAGQHVDGGTAAFQRIIGGLLVAAICLLIVKRHHIKEHSALSFETGTDASTQKWKRIWPWVLGNSLAGQTLGVSCQQWALETISTGVFLSILALTPLVAIPITLIIEGERPTIRSIIGGAIAVAGVIGLVWAR